MDDFDDHYPDEGDGAYNAPPATGMSSGTKAVLWILGGLAVFCLFGIYIIMASCSAFLSDVTKDMDKWVTDGSYSPFRKLEVQDVEAFVRAETDAAGGGMAGGDLRKVVIKGRVTSIDRKPPDHLEVVFRTSAGEVRCRFLRSVVDDLKDAQAGDRLVVGGMIDWINKDTVQLKDCMLQEHWQRPGRQPK